MKLRLVERGFGLIEVMLALVMLTLLMTATGVMMTNLVMTTRRSERRVQAVSVARSVVDEIRARAVSDLAGSLGNPVTLENRIRAADTQAPIQIGELAFNYRVTFCPDAADTSGGETYCRNDANAAIRHFLVEVLDPNDEPLYTVENVYTDLRR